MKIREDFVSNSSSSSFIVIRNSGKYTNEIPGAVKDEKLVLPSEKIGPIDFGWETCIYDSPGAKINWTACILISMHRAEQNIAKYKAKGQKVPKWATGFKHIGRFAEYETRFVRIMKSEFGLDVSLIQDSEDSWSYDFGIDHQSDYEETPKNADMLESDAKLRDFLCNSDSHIDNSNDNGGRFDIEN